MREDQPIASPVNRLEMIQLAIMELPEKFRARVRISEIEIRRAGPSYTIDTVEELQRENPNLHFVLILGSDAYANFDKWHRSEDLRRIIELLVIARDGDGLEIDALDVSSTAIRRQLHHNQDLPETIWKYIQERNLYASK